MLPLVLKCLEKLHAVFVVNFSVSEGSLSTRLQEELANREEVEHK